MANYENLLYFNDNVFLFLQNYQPIEIRNIEIEILNIFQPSGVDTHVWHL